MSSLLYQLSYNLYTVIYIRADKGFAPIDTGHEPIMFLLHQSAKKKLYYYKNNLYSPSGVRTHVCNDENIMS